MTTCGTRPVKVTLNDLASIPIGQRFTGTGCCPRTNKTLQVCSSKGFSWPSNGEFEWGGGGAGCKLCSGEYGCECARSAIGGVRPTVRRISYKGDATICCRTSYKTQGNFTCDPAFNRPTNAACITSMYNYCEKDTRFFTDAQCASWVNFSAANKESAFSRMQSLANDVTRVEYGWAKDWCMKNPGKCDAMMNAYCKKYPNSEHCKCINSKTKQIAGIQFNPACVDEACIKGDAYKTANMLGACNINALECNQYNTLINNGVSVASNLYPTQTCKIEPPAVAKPPDSFDLPDEKGIDLSTPPSGGINGGGGGTFVNDTKNSQTFNGGSTPPVTPPSLFGNKMVLILILIVVIVCGLLLGWGLGWFGGGGGVGGGSIATSPLSRDKATPAMNRSIFN